MLPDDFNPIVNNGIYLWAIDVLPVNLTFSNTDSVKYNKGTKTFKPHKN